MLTINLHRGSEYSSGDHWTWHMVEQTTQVISVHGDSGSEEIVYVGGLDDFLCDGMIEALGKAGFTEKDRWNTRNDRFRMFVGTVRDVLSGYKIS